MNYGNSRPPVRVAIVGLGRAAMADHYPFFREHKDLFNVVAACDLQKSRRDAVKADFPSCRVFRHYSDMLEMRDIDLVDICTGSTLHCKMAVESLGKGFWTVLESPLVTNEADVLVVRGAAMRAKNRLIVVNRGLYSPDFMLARRMIADKRLGTVYQLVVRSEDFIRRDDWQSVKRMGGGAAYYAMPDIMMATLRLLPTPPVQMMSELKRLVSVGDIEDYVHIVLKTRTRLSADIEFNGAAMPGPRQPSFAIRGDNGIFTVQQGATSGVLRMIDPEHKLPRRRSAISTPKIVDMHEDVKMVDIPIDIGADVPYGMNHFWHNVYDTVRTGYAFPVSYEESMNVLKYSQLMRKASPFGA